MSYLTKVVKITQTGDIPQLSRYASGLNYEYSFYLL